MLPGCVIGRISSEHRRSRAVPLGPNAATQGLSTKGSARHLAGPYDYFRRRWRGEFFFCFPLGLGGVFDFAPLATFADSASSASICSTVGSADCRLFGSARVISYSEMPIGLLTPRSAYSATMLFRSWQRMSPID